LAAGLKKIGSAFKTEGYTDGDRVTFAVVYWEIKSYRGSAASLIAGMRIGMNSSGREMLYSTTAKNGEIVAIHHVQIDANVVETQLRVALDSQDTMHLLFGGCTLDPGFNPASAELCRSTLQTLQLAIPADQRKNPEAADSEPISRQVWLGSGFVVGLVLSGFFVWLWRRRD
jgi:hypothetical protein